MRLELLISSFEFDQETSSCSINLLNLYKNLPLRHWVLGFGELNLLFVEFDTLNCMVVLLYILDSLPEFFHILWANYHPTNFHHLHRGLLLNLHCGYLLKIRRLHQSVHILVIDDVRDCDIEAVVGILLVYWLQFEVFVECYFGFCCEVVSERFLEWPFDLVDVIVQLVF